MKNLAQYLSQYAAYHRDPRNIATHFIGIPMIVLAIVILLAQPVFYVVAGVALTPALIISILALLFYARLDRVFAIVMAAFLGLCLFVASLLVQSGQGVLYSTGLGLFLVGWIIQFVGHVFEGKKPAFVDDIIGLLIGPLFVVAECFFLLGLRQNLKLHIEQAVGPVAVQGRIS